jgi:Lrp/AsnC family leucine-responsive transcriptional regulator
MKNREYEENLLDKFDISLLQALQEDASLTHQQLSERVHLSASQVSRRTQRLRDIGFIAKTVALVDSTRAGLGVRAVAHVAMQQHSDAERLAFETTVAAMDDVLQCISVAGESDYVLHLVAPDLSTLSKKVLQRLTQIRGVSSVRSSVVLECIKSTTRLPLNHLA